MDRQADYFIGIPSYHRCGRVKTLAHLQGAGFSKEDVRIFTQTQEDFDAYSAAYGDIATIRLNPAHNLPCARNNVLIEAERDGRQVLMLDDDISAFWICRKIGVPNKEAGKRKIQGAELRAVFDWMFATARAGKFPLFGVALTDNPFFGKKDFTTGGLLGGWLLGFVSPALRFSEDFPQKHDWEISLRTENTLRFNRVFCTHALNSKHGGITYTTENQRRGCELLLALYPDKLKPHPSRRFEVALKRERTQK